MCPVRAHYIWGESSLTLLLNTVSLIHSLQWGESTRWNTNSKRVGYIKPGVLNDPDVSSLSLHDVVCWADMNILSPDVAASGHIAEMLLSAEEGWHQTQVDPSTPPPPSDQRYDGGSHDVNTPVKNLYVHSFYIRVSHVERWCTCFSFWHIVATSSNVFPSHRLSFRNPLGLPISKRDSLLEKCTMFRDAGAALSRHPSQDNGLDGPFGSGTSKVEQVPVFFSILHIIFFWPNSVCVCGTMQ